MMLLPADTSALPGAAVCPTYGVIVPMATEFHAFKKRLDAAKDIQKKVVSGKTYFVQEYSGYRLVMCECGIGKVCSSTVAAIMIGCFDVSLIVLIGVAGGLKTGISVGDIVVVDSVMQHDFDCRPFFPRHTIISINTDKMFTDAKLVNVLTDMSAKFLKEGYEKVVPQSLRVRYKLSQPVLHVGCSVAGDKFLESLSAKEEIKQRIPGVVAIEMEGGAVGQVCYEAGKPFVSLRVVSDLCDGNGLEEYDVYCESVASEVLNAIVSEFLSRISSCM